MVTQTLTGPQPSTRDDSRVSLETHKEVIDSEGEMPTSSCQLENFYKEFLQAEIVLATATNSVSQAIGAGDIGNGFRALDGKLEIGWGRVMNGIDLDTDILRDARRNGGTRGRNGNPSRRGSWNSAGDLWQCCSHSI